MAKKYVNVQWIPLVILALLAASCASVTAVNTEPPLGADSDSPTATALSTQEQVPEPTEIPITPYVQLDSLDGVEFIPGQKVTVTGMGAGAFEGTVVIELVDADGEVIAQQPTMIDAPDAGLGQKGPWQVEIMLPAVLPPEITVVAFIPTPKDGSRVASDQKTVQTSAVETEINLENTPWLLVDFSKSEYSPLLFTHVSTLLFDPAEGQAGGSASCNLFSGTYQIDGENLVFGPFMTTLRACDETSALVEQTVLENLALVAKYSLSGNNLALLDADGHMVLQYILDPFSKSDTFDRQMLANTTYQSTVTNGQAITLTNGQYRASIMEGSATEIVVTLGNSAAFGDLDGDGVEDAVVILVSETGGSGTFFELAVVQIVDRNLINSATDLLGDRVKIGDLSIEDGEILVEMLVAGPDDPLCCPNTPEVRRYRFDGSLSVIE